MNILPNLYRYPYVCIWGFPGGSDDKESACNSGDLGSIPGWGRSPGEGNGNPPQFSCLENPHGQRSLVGCSPWDHKELDTTEWLTLSLFHIYIIYISYISLSYIYHIYISLQCRRPGFYPGLGRSSGKQNGNPLQYSCLENSMNRGTWQIIVFAQRVGHDWATNTPHVLHKHGNIGAQM